MGSKTSNAFGDITISNRAIALVVFDCALDCYGVIDLVARDTFDAVKEVFIKSRKSTRGVKIKAFQNRINVDVYVILKYGVSTSAVTKSLRDAIKYNVEGFTGMIVNSVNVHIVGVRV